MNPADTLWHPVWDNMEYQKQLKLAARILQRQYGPGAFLTGPTGSPLDEIAPIYAKHGNVESELTENEK